MGIRKTTAKAVSSVSRAALRHIFHRPAGNFPGKAALLVDPAIIAEEALKLRQGSICVVGTNGKTTVTNMLADCLEMAGQAVVCNRTGANLDSGVATSLLSTQAADWGVFECDELWLEHILPHLQSRYCLLLNLFYDQLDRIGEIDRIQESIATALKASPQTVLIYNADDPRCEKIARMVDNRSVPFGFDGSPSGMGKMRTETQLCQHCDSVLGYRFRTYSQLGDYACPSCHFARSHPQFMASNWQREEAGMSFDVVAAADEQAADKQAADKQAADEQAAGGTTLTRIEAPYSGIYMVYNLLAVFAAGHLVGLSNNVMQVTAARYDAHNGRLERMTIAGRKVLLNLAKNPTGFNQNIALGLLESGPLALAFFVNDKEGDGRDVSWLWDVDFESFANRPDCRVFAGGMRAHDLQLRLKYAGIEAQLVENAIEVMEQVKSLPEDYQVFMIANYTALPDVREDCVNLAEGAARDSAEARTPESPAQEANPAEPGAPAEPATPVPPTSSAPPAVPAPPVPPAALQPSEGIEALRIVHLYPDLLDQGGDSGNSTVLEKRCTWRGIPVEIEQVSFGQVPDFARADIVLLGDGFDRQQRLACSQLLPYKDFLANYVASGGVMLAVDGGLQILGESWYIGNQRYEGLGILGMRNGRAEKDERIVGDVVVETPLVPNPVIGFENHAGVTHLDDQSEPFGNVTCGIGNNAGDSTEGILSNNVVGTYVHGPVLAKSPQLADWLIVRALERKGAPISLAALDDSVEEAAAAFMRKRLGV